MNRILRNVLLISALLVICFTACVHTMETTLKVINGTQGYLTVEVEGEQTELISGGAITYSWDVILDGYYDVDISATGQYLSEKSIYVNLASSEDREVTITTHEGLIMINNQTGEIITEVYISAEINNSLETVWGDNLLDFNIPIGGTRKFLLSQNAYDCKVITASGAEYTASWSEIGTLGPNELLEWVVTP